MANPPPGGEGRELVMKNKTFLKKVGHGLIILIITILTFKFIMWNYWKLERAAALAKGIIKAPSAVNLILSKKNTGSVLFRKSFAYNHNGNYYIIDHFDISPYIDNNLKVTLAVNDQNAQSLLLHRFKTFTIVTVKGQHFVFTTPNCGIEEFVELKKALPFTINSLDKGRPRRSLIKNRRTFPFYVGFHGNK